jgi:hypothetical protein
MTAAPGKVLVHFKGWGRADGKSRWDAWMPKDSARMAPLGLMSAPAALKAESGAHHP